MYAVHCTLYIAHFKKNSPYLQDTENKKCCNIAYILRLPISHFNSVIRIDCQDKSYPRN